MSTIRIIGSAILLCVSIILSQAITSTVRKREVELVEICDLIRFIRNNIDSFLTPIGAILSGYSSPALKRCGFTSAMHISGLAAAVNTDGISLFGNERELLSAFAEKLGLGYREEEVRLCDYYLAEFTEIAKREKEENDKKSRMYRYLPPLAALSLIIILI